MAETIISGMFFGLCALIMFGIGISQLKSKKPVGFYSGEKAPESEQLTDISAWNRKHGIMWMVYGCCIVTAWIVGLFMGDSILVLIPFAFFFLVPIPIMIICHNKMIKKYYVRYGGQNVERN